MTRTAILAPLLLATLSVDAEPPVVVRLDLDARRPGYQHRIVVAEDTTAVRDATVSIYDPLGQREFFSIGYVGGIDRGIAFGHMPGQGLRGRINGYHIVEARPVNPGNTPEVLGDGSIIKAFAGPELQYLEFGAAGAAVIPAPPVPPVLRFDVELNGAQAGDVFDFFLVDYVTVWRSGQAGALSTNEPLNELDTGGDAVPDQTRTLQGVDPDPPQPVPPAAFYVDYIDGPPSGGPATIVVMRLADVNCDGAVNFGDVNPFILALSDPEEYERQFPLCDRVLADCNRDGRVDFGDINPFVERLSRP